MAESTQLAEFLQYGAMGLLAMMLLGVAWYVRGTMQQQVTREAAAAKEREKQLEAWIGLVEVIGRLNERQAQMSGQLEQHATDTTRRHDKIEADQTIIKTELTAIKDRLTRATG